MKGAGVSVAAGRLHLLQLVAVEALHSAVCDSLCALVVVGLTSVIICREQHLELAVKAVAQRPPFAPNRADPRHEE